jgi:hypothetical protein
LNPHPLTTVECELLLTGKEHRRGDVVGGATSYELAVAKAIGHHLQTGDTFSSSGD